MKIKEVKELETKELVEKLENAVAAYNQKKLNHNITPLENPSEIKVARRDIARMKTELRQRELTNNNGPDGNKKFKKSKTGCCHQQQNG